MSNLRLFLDTGRGYLALLKVLLRLWWPNQVATKKEEGVAILLAEALPPFVTAGTFRPLSWLRYSDEHGWRINAYGLNSEAGFSRSEYLLDQVSGENKIRYVSPDHPKTSWRFFPNVDGGLLTAVNYFNSVLADQACKKPQVIVATGPSFCNLVAGYWLSRYYSVPLFVDFRDEWSFCPRGFVEHYPFDKYWESKILNHCRSAFVVTPVMKEIYSSIYPQFAEKFKILTNGIELNDIGESSSVESCHDRRSLIVRYVGTVGTWTDPSAFVESLVGLSKALDFKVVVEFVGGFDSRISEALIGSQGVEIKFIGKVDKNLAHSYMESADLLLQLSPPGTETAYPLKLFDYMHTSKPILIYGEKYQFADIVLNNDAGYFVNDNDVDALRCALLESYAIKVGEMPSLDCEKRVRWVNAHTREKLARDFYEYLEAYGR